MASQARWDLPRYKGHKSNKQNKAVIFNKKIVSEHIYLNIFIFTIR